MSDQVTKEIHPLVKLDLISKSLTTQLVLDEIEKVIPDFKGTTDQEQLLKAIILVEACLYGARNFLLGTLKESKKSTDLTCSILVDIDTHFELLKAHLEVLLKSDVLDETFDQRLRLGARLAEEFMSELHFSLSKASITLVSELGVKSKELKEVALNASTVSDALLTLIQKVPGRYDLLSVGLLGV
jgi:hypothetical protein